MRTGIMFNGLGIILVILGDAMDLASYHHSIGGVIVGIGALLVILGTLLLSGATKGAGKTMASSGLSAVPS